jgi:hypothetical protein
MTYRTELFRSRELLSREDAETFFSARDIAKARLAVHQVRSGATHAIVCSADGAVMFDSRVDAPRRSKTKSVPLMGLVKRTFSQSTLGSV